METLSDSTALKGEKNYSRRGGCSVAEDLQPVAADVPFVVADPRSDAA